MFASLRHPDVYVMAPASVKAGPSQNFKLLPVISPPVSLSHVNLNGLYGDNILSYCERTHSSLVASKSFNGVKSVALKKCNNDLSSLALQISNEIPTIVELPTQASPTLLSQQSDFMMNNCDPSMGDKVDNMGLDNVNSSGVCFEGGQVLNKSNMDQAVKNLSVADGGGKELVQNVDYLLQTLNSDDQLPRGAIGLGNLDSSDDENTDGFLDSNLRALVNDGCFQDFADEILNEDVMPTSDEIIGSLMESDSFTQMGQDSSLMEGGSITDMGNHNALIESDRTEGSMIKRDCLATIGSDNSLMQSDNLARIGNSLVESDSLAEMGDDALYLRIKETKRKNGLITQTNKRLIRRSKLLVAKKIGQHAAEEVMGLFEEARRMVNRCVSSKAGSISQSEFESPVYDGSGSSKGDSSVHKEKKVSPSVWENLLKKLDAITRQQAAASKRPHHKYFGSGSTDVKIPTNGGPKVIPKFNHEVKENLTAFAQQLHTQMSMVQSGVDSDATASSSDGESCDEMQTYNNPHQQQLSISKRAEWQWQQDRAAVAFRWTWLTYQVSDLEHRIRMQNDFARSLYESKGDVILDEQKCAASAAGSTGRNVRPPVLVNGFHGALPGNIGTKSLESASDESCTRHRPFAREVFQKRKLFPMRNLHLTSKKASKPASLQCGCEPPQNWCAVCTGRADPTYPQERDDMTVGERIALLDPGFHPVLSFPEDVPQRLYYDAIMKTPEWQHKTLKSSVGGSKFLDNYGISKLSRENNMERLPGKQPPRKYRRLQKVPPDTFTSKTSKKERKKQLERIDSSSDPPRKRQSMPKSGSAFRGPSASQKSDDGEDNSRSPDRTSSRNPSPVSSPGPLSAPSTPLKVLTRRKRENSYDIDNIVIACSVVAPTRLEKLQYKEIPTPKWRVVDEDIYSSQKSNVQNIGASTEESDEEDISDETIQHRHDRCFLEEKKKFMSYIRFPLTGRARAQRRADSRADSSGTNTPDRQSPNPSSMIDSHLESPLTSPGIPSGEIDTSSIPLGSRRHTTSLSRCPKEWEEAISSTSDPVEEVSPYELRTFPLSDAEYEKICKTNPERNRVSSYLRAPKRSTKEEDDDFVDLIDVVN